MKQISIYALFVPLIEILSSGAIGLLIWYGGGKVIQETITLGVLVAFLSYIRMFFQPIRDLSEKYTILQSAMASLERIYALLDHEERVSVSSSPIQSEVKGALNFAVSLFPIAARKRSSTRSVFPSNQVRRWPSLGPRARERVPSSTSLNDSMRSRKEASWSMGSISGNGISRNSGPRSGSSCKIPFSLRETSRRIFEWGRGREMEGE